MVDLLPLLRCPACGSTDFAAPAECRGCGRSYPVSDGIPVLLPDEPSEETQRQAAYFDRHSDTEFEIERPRGTTRLYQWLLGEKFARSVRGLGHVGGSTALVVCGGSGMDAEFLTAAGASVVSADISVGAARRAGERARRHGLDITPVVADAEQLPFADRSFDLVYVHDGLHHLAHPERGIAEMARVARRAVSITEPARAALTKLAVRAGLALEREEAGNPVARLDVDEVSEALRRDGFRIVEAHRYGMYYRHHPGRASHFLSRPRLFPHATATLRSLNDLAGGLGNKLTVQAVRISQ